ncbi:MAG: hypothetical protein ACLUFN_06480 [Eubacterium sp.]
MNKKIISIMGVLLVILSCFSSINVFAADDVDNQIDEYITFENPSSGISPRINSNGSFTFNVRKYLKSGTFTANSTSITIQTKARIYNNGTGKYTTSNSSKFQVVLRKKSTGKNMGSYVGKADNIYGGLKFTGLTKNEKYYFEIIILDENIYYSTYQSIKGTGTVSGVTV